MLTGSVARWKAAVAAAIAAAELRLDQLGVSTSDNDIFTFREIAARGKHRFDLKLDASEGTAALLAELADAPWMPLVRSTLGPRTTMAASVVYSRPGADAQVRSVTLGCAYKQCEVHVR